MNLARAHDHEAVIFSVSNINERLTSVLYPGIYMNRAILTPYILGVILLLQQHIVIAEASS